MPVTDFFSHLALLLVKLSCLGKEKEVRIHTCFNPKTGITNGVDIKDSFRVV